MNAGIVMLWACVMVLCAWSVVGEAQECASEGTGAHSSTTVLYGSPGDTSQATVITPTSDGTVHAIDAATGAPLWSFVPPEAAASAAEDRITDIRILRFDANNDGIIDIGDGDKVWLYFGLRQAGPYYYALDITDRADPQLLWRLGADALDGLANAWSTPTIARVRIAGATQNGEHFVLVFGGGLGTTPAGDRIFMIDAATGRLLWSVGADEGARTPDLVLNAMNAAVPARVAVLDTDGDEFADRMYAVDVAGRVWRFDIWNGHARDTLVTGGVLADLTGEGRAFFNAADVALIQPRGGDAYYNVALGSGDPRVATAGATNFFYSVRDKEPFTRRSQTSYDAATPILPADLVDIGAATAGVPREAAGWKVDLRAIGASGSVDGTDARVFGESLTANGVVLFTTFQSAPGTDPCTVGGTSRIFAVRVDNGAPALDLDDDGEVTATDLSMPLPISGVPGEIRIEPGVPSADSTGDGGSSDGKPAPSSAPPARCLVGSYVLATCVPLRTLVRTFWQRPSIN